MEGAGFERFLILPQVQRFLGRIDAITGCAMQVEIDVDSMFAAKIDGIVDVFQVRLADLQQLFGICPTQVGKWQTREIETPFGKERKIAFLKRGGVASAPFNAFLGE